MTGIHLNRDAWEVVAFLVGFLAVVLVASLARRRSP
jgi:hypothetical protein